ncbi:MAG: hypothetical protein RL213_2055 [Bacteroidota bacterium]|jgi:hypothetical protein
MKIVTESSAWWIILCVLAGAGYAYLLYRHPSPFTSRLRSVLAVFRGIVVALLCFLLLNPLIRTVSREREKPLLILAADDSESMLSSDTAAARTALPAFLKRISNGVGDKYEVHVLSFSDRVEEGKPLEFRGQQTDYSALIKALNDRYSNRNVGAVVIATDGLYNKGANPVFDPLDIKAPVHTVALGDTTVRKDLVLSDVAYNRTAYLGNTFPLEITVSSRQCSGSSFNLTVSQDSAVLFRRNITAAGNRYRLKVPVALDAKKKGLMRLHLELTSLPGEVSSENNSRDIYVEVRESKEKVLVLANAPHPDLGAIRTQLEQSQNYSVTVKMIDEAPSAFNEFNLVVLHDLPSNRNPLTELFSKLRAAGTPSLFILGSQTDLVSLNRLEAGLKVITNTAGKSNAVQLALNPSFSLFTLSQETGERVSGFPPLQAPFGEYRPDGAPAVLGYQQVGAVRTNEPLLFFLESGNNRSGFICGEGYWRWPVSEYARFGSVLVSREILVKSVQYLSVKDQRSRFRITAKNSYNENEPVLMDAELFNENFEMVNSPEVKVEITDRSGKKFPFVFSKTERAYALNAGFLPPGDYSYRASAQLGDRSSVASGSFSVAEIRAEQTETVADHALLGALASAHGGEMFSLQEGDELLSTLLEDDQSKIVSYSRIRLQDLIDWKWLFALLTLLLGVEWLLRKRAGSY